tara:strand:+ start:36838 stop:37443 length:606 start_codon:yes stop_codon:yes gene_type:complete
MNSDFFCFNTREASHRLILLHGWGADADDLAPLGQSLINGINPKIEICLLRAPQKNPQGMGRQWYPLFPAEWAEVPSAVKALKNRVKEMATEEIPLDKTVILGFSQGGAMALAAGCSLPLAGLICCSAYPHPDWNTPLKIPPILLTHGINDEIVPVNASQKIATLIRAKNLDIDIELFNGGHEIPQELIFKFQLKLKEWFI